MLPKRVTILGVGLLGGSIGLACKSATSSCKIIGYGHRLQTLQRALEIGAIDECTQDLAAAVRDSELIILCTPVGLFPEILRQIAPLLASGTVVTDVGSTKRSIVQAAQRHLPPHAHFVGSHPMAGSEKRGVEFAKTDLFRNALCITTPTPKTNPHALALVEDFWQTLGMRITRLSPREHDRLLANISHLPHLLAAALIALQPDKALPLAGKGFLDTTRIAGGDGPLWRDILLDNRDNLAASIGRLQKQLQSLQSLLKKGNGPALTAWLNAAAARREGLLQQKLREINLE